VDFWRKSIFGRALGEVNIRPEAEFVKWHQETVYIV
jgi:hypothetical protein